MFRPRRSSSATKPDEADEVVNEDLHGRNVLLSTSFPAT